MRAFLLACMLMLAQDALAGPQPPCGCAQFQAGAVSMAAPGTAALALSADALALRDFVLYSHRKIADELAGQPGAYRATLLAALRVCSDATVKLDWLRRAVAETADTQAFAERVARAADQHCGAADAPR